METFIPSVYEEMLNKALSIVTWLNNEKHSALLSLMGSSGIYMPQWMYDEKVAVRKTDLAYCISFLSVEDKEAIKELQL